MPNPSPSHPSIRTHRFDEVPVPRIQRSSFDLSFKNKTTFYSGYLIPMCKPLEVLPGDTFNVRASFFGRLQTLDFPILDNIFFDTFWFYCPNRILWTNWPKFLGARSNPSDPIDFTIPAISWDGDPPAIEVHTLPDYFGLPIGQTMFGIENINALPFRMYPIIWNEWFRAQELQDSISVDLGDGPDVFPVDAPFSGLLRRGKRHDYITSCLIAPQRGDSVSLPIGDTAPVIGDGSTLGFRTGVGGSGSGFGLYTDPGNNQSGFFTSGYNQVIGYAGSFVGAPGSQNFVGISDVAAESGLIADLSEAVSATINDMREAIALQQILERDARMGTRYTERIWGQFRVVVPDFTAQRPEYLGGSIDRVGILQVPQTTASPVTPTMSDAKGALAAYAQIQASSGFTRSFVEHGYIMCLGALRAELTWQQRIDRMWTRETRQDFYDPLMAHLGEQAVLNKEVAFFAASTPDDVFGYQERWAEYRSNLSMVTGKFRSDAAGTLDAWHLSLDFASEPSLNDAFIQDTPPLSRVLAVTSEPECLMDIAIQIRGARPMPVYSIPGLERL